MQLVVTEPLVQHDARPRLKSYFRIQSMHHTLLTARSRIPRMLHAQTAGGQPRKDIFRQYHYDKCLQ